jgi:hypothetical protein
MARTIPMPAARCSSIFPPCAGTTLCELFHVPIQALPCEKILPVSARRLGRYLTGQSPLQASWEIHRPRCLAALFRARRCEGDFWHRFLHLANIGVSTATRSEALFRPSPGYISRSPMLKDYQLQRCYRFLAENRKVDPTRGRDGRISTGSR